MRAEVHTRRYSLRTEQAYVDWTRRRVLLRHARRRVQADCGRMPTLVTVGRHDPICPPREAVDIARALPPGVATLRIFKHSARRPWVEEGELYFRELGIFLNRPATPGG